MKYSELSAFAQADLLRVVNWLEKDGQGEAIERLRRTMNSPSPIIEQAITYGLGAAEFERATPYMKRLVGWLMMYATEIKAAEPHVIPEYSRDRAARLKSEKLGLPDDMTSTQQWVTLPVELEDWWKGLTPEQRGRVVVAGKESGKLE